MKTMTTSITVTITDPAGADKAVYNALTSALGGGAPAGGTTPVNYFPTDPTLAPAPSPEDSIITILNGVVMGRPYLVDSNKQIWTLSIVSGIGTAHIGNTLVGGGGSASGINQLQVRQGQVWCILSGGQQQYWNPAQGSLYNGAMPPAWTTPATGGTPGLPALPPLPTPASVAPGSSGKIILCGMGLALPSLSAAIPTAGPGDTVKLLPGNYTDTPPAWTVPLLIDLGGATFNATGKTATLARGKGLLVPSADSIIQNGTITGVAMDQTSGQLTCAIRPDAGCGYLTIKNVKATGNQCAVGEGGIGPCVIELDNCDISNNGLTANTGALTHDLYVGQDCVKLTLNNVTANGANEAHAIKYRGPRLIVQGGTFASAPGKPFDLPNGSTVPFAITGASIMKAAADADHGVLAYGEEGATNGLAGGTINGGSIAALCPNPTISGPGGTITVTGATLSGNKIAATGAIVVVGT
jgi:hypothetical protein